MGPSGVFSRQYATRREIGRCGYGAVASLVWAGWQVVVPGLGSLQDPGTGKAGLE